MKLYNLFFCSVHGQLGCFQVWAITNNDALNILFRNPVYMCEIVSRADNRHGIGAHR